MVYLCIIQKCMGMFHIVRNNAPTFAVCSIVMTTFDPGVETRSMAPPIPFTILPWNTATGIHWFIYLFISSEFHYTLKNISLVRGRPGIWYLETRPGLVGKPQPSARWSKIFQTTTSWTLTHIFCRHYVYTLTSTWLSSTSQRNSTSQNTQWEKMCNQL